MEIVVLILGALRRAVQRIGPYLLVELVLPGGTLLALLLFLYRRRQLRLASSAAVETTACRGGQRNERMDGIASRRVWNDYLLAVRSVPAAARH